MTVNIIHLPKQVTYEISNMFTDYNLTIGVVRSAVANSIEAQLEMIAEDTPDAGREEVANKLAKNVREASIDCLTVMLREFTDAVLHAANTATIDIRVRGLFYSPNGFLQDIAVDLDVQQGRDY